MSFLFAPPQQSVIPVQDERYLFFPVRRLWCTQGACGEGASSDPASLAFYLRPTDALQPVTDAAAAILPAGESGMGLSAGVEVAACLSEGGSSWTREEAEAAVWGWCTAITFTRPGAPLSEAALAGPVPVSHLRPAYRTPLPGSCDMFLYLNNAKRQAGNTARAAVDPIGVLCELSRRAELEPGDVVLFGTPAGASPVRAGDAVMAGVNGVGTFTVQAVS